MKESKTNRTVIMGVVSFILAIMSYWTAIICEVIGNKIAFVGVLFYTISMIILPHSLLEGKSWKMKLLISITAEVILLIPFIIIVFIKGLF